jgi:GNAT superfamily N-acetyltransferase
MSWDDLDRPGVSGRPSELDTARFGRRVARITVGPDQTDPGRAADEVASMFRAMGPDVAVVRWPAGLVALGAHLVHRGLRVVPADVLVYWEARLPAGPLPEGIAVDVLGDVPGFAATLPRLARDVFEGYDSHYSAALDLDQEAVLEGYVDWATRTSRVRPEDTFVAHEAGEALAFATTARLEDGTTVEVELAGTTPASRGRGVYSRLMSAVMATAAARGAERLVISTQASNTAVQRSWARLGLLPAAAFTTVHLRAEAPGG